MPLYVRNGRIFWVICALSAAVLGGALGFQYIGGYAPCPLCITQRWAHVAIIALCIIAWFWPKREKNLRILLLLVGGTALVSAAIAFYHAGVEWGFLEGPSGCSAPNIAEMSLDDQLKALLQTAVVRCDEIVWSLFGLSMAGYNALISFLLALIALACAYRHKGYENA